MNKKELIGKLENMLGPCDSVWVYNEGNGMVRLPFEQLENLAALIMDGRYLEPVVLEKGKEDPGFMRVMPAEEYEATECFVWLEYVPDFNQESFGLQIQMW
jgi:hypothetical protein